MMSGKDVHDEELELSDLSIRILDLMDQYICCKVNIEHHIRSACLDLAKARYINGNKSISSLQLPNEDTEGINANFKVATHHDNSFAKYRYYKINEGKNDLIHRKTSDKSKTNFSAEPLNWFGVLVPQSLKQAKITFEKCLDMVVENANIKVELEECMQKYVELKKNISIIQQ